jgi:streptomycin 6-kinase
MPKSVLTTSTSLHSSLPSYRTPDDDDAAAAAAAAAAVALRPCLRSASAPLAQLGAWSSSVSSSSMSDSSLSTGSLYTARRSASRSGDRNSQPRIE